MPETQSQTLPANIARLLEGFNNPNYRTLRDWVRHLRAENRSPKTVVSYLDAARKLDAHVDGGDLIGLDHHELEDFFAEALVIHAPSSVAVYYRSLQQLYRWLVAEGLVEVSPFVRMSPPTVPEGLVPILRPDQTFGDRRRRHPYERAH